ncbi:MAG TPA: aminoacyl-tRNA hydrolase [Longimicrobiales bacterium]|nr:aminoacyl-tRNA hydrolase [Longimicrobiales bacterium]
MKVICGLGNPGAEYEETRHNVGWWVVEEAQATWRFPEFRRAGAAWVSEGRVGEHDVVLVEPLTFMNRSGAALAALPGTEGFDVARDLLVVVDDVALDAGRVRFRARGSAGGHNGLKSVESTLGTQEYARLRIGVGTPPSGADLATWVLSPFDEAGRDAVVERLPELVDALRTWLDDGVEAAGNRYNR